MLEKAYSALTPTRSHTGDQSAIASFGQNVNLVGVVLSLVVVGVIALVGVLVMSTVSESTSLDNNSSFYSGQQDIIDGLNSAFGLMEVVFIVLLLSAIIALLIGLRGR